MASKEQPFSSDQFTPTQWTSAEEKAQWANAMASWVSKEFPEQGFTRRIYEGLLHIYGHIAHYDKGGFYTKWFRGNQCRLAWLKYAAKGGAFTGGAGDPAWTWSDVERGFSRWVKESGFIARYEELCATEMETRERILLAELQTKYVGWPAEQRQEPFILLPELGPLAQILHNASVDIRLPNNAAVRLDWNETGYSFTWLRCFKGSLAQCRWNDV